MQILCFENADQVGKSAAMLVGAQILRKPTCVLGLATGSSPIRMYQQLISMNNEGLLDFSNVTSFNLDEYCHLPVDHECSYHYFMRSNLFDHTNIQAKNTHLPNGNAANPAEEGIRYDCAIAQAGGIDLQILGIGHNAHIGFNEPSNQFMRSTHVTTLAESTIHANRRFFASETDVPRQAITMGIGSIMKAKAILLIATGEDKAQAIQSAVEGNVTPLVPASILQLHPQVTILLDQAAASLLRDH